MVAAGHKSPRAAAGTAHHPRPEVQGGVGFAGIQALLSRRPQAAPAARYTHPRPSPRAREFIIYLFNFFISYQQRGPAASSLRYLGQIAASSFWSPQQAWQRADSGLEAGWRYQGPRPEGQGLGRRP